MSRDGAVKTSKMSPEMMAQMQADAAERIERFGWDSQNPRCGSNKKASAR